MATKYTQDERQIAQQICKSPAMLKFLEKLFLPDRNKVRLELEKNIAALSDEDYGKAMKVLYASETHFQNQMDELKIAGNIHTAKPRPIAPK